MITVGDKFPSFTLTGVYGAEDEFAFEEISEEAFRGVWSVFVGYPRDFTFVCPTELLGYNALWNEFTQRNTVIYGLSTDSCHVHRAWRQSRGDLGAVRFALLADEEHELSRALGILRNGATMRATVIVDRDRVVRHVTVNDDLVGRNPKETLRILDALQTNQLTPCGWKKGDPTL